MANLRISLGIEVRPGNEHAAAKGLPGLWDMLGKLTRDQWPTFSRGDSGYGSESIMLEYEERGLPYLFKLRHPAHAHGQSRSSGPKWWPVDRQSQHPPRKRRRHRQGRHVD